MRLACSTRMRGDPPLFRRTVPQRRLENHIIAEISCNTDRISLADTSRIPKWKSFFFFVLVKSAKYWRNRPEKNQEETEKRGRRVPFRTNPTPIEREREGEGTETKERETERQTETDRQETDRQKQREKKRETGGEREEGGGAEEEEEEEDWEKKWKG